MKRLTLLLLGLVLGVSATANAQGLTMQMSNGWTFSFSGNVNAFWVFTKENANAGDAANSSIRTGLLPGFATFEAKGKEGGLNLGVHIGFAPQIQNPDNCHDNFNLTCTINGIPNLGSQAGAQIDMRQIYLTVGFKNGSSILAGRELGLFGRQNILNDMTLFGVGAVGIGGGQGGGTTLGRIGYGYIYPNFQAQVTYSTKPGQAQFSVGIFQPSTIPGTGGASYAFTKVPRLEGEFTYNQKSGKNAYMVWVGGLWQTTSDLATGGTSLSSFGGTAGVRADISDLQVVVSGYIGKAIGTTLMFSGGEVGAVDGTKGRPSDGGYAQLMYKVGPKTRVGASWGFSRLKSDATGDGFDAVLQNWFSYTAGVYHQWTKSLKLVLEGTREQNDNGSGAPAQVDIAGGLMLFF